MNLKPSTKEQREGLSRFFDTIAASAFVGAVLGITGRSPMTWYEIAVLLATCPILLSFSYFLRGKK
jgi:hypothetical protein